MTFATAYALGCRKTIAETPERSGCFATREACLSRAMDRTAAVKWRHALSRRTAVTFCARPGNGTPPQSQISKCAEAARRSLLCRLRRTAHAGTGDGPGFPESRGACGGARPHQPGPPPDLRAPGPDT